MDQYSLFCFNKLKEKHPDYLANMGFESVDSILNLSDNSFVSGTNLVICKFCKKKNAIERMQQLRSIDEGETLIIYCRNCNKTYTD